MLFICVFINILNPRIMRDVCKIIKGIQNRLYFKLLSPLYYCALLLDRRGMESFISRIKYYDLRYFWCVKYNALTCF